MYAFCWSYPSATFASQHGGFVPREWQAAKGLFSLTDWFLARVFFQLVLSECTNQPCKCKNLNFYDVTLLFSLWSTKEPEEVKPLEDTQAPKEQAQVASDSKNSSVTQSNATTSAEQTSATQASSAQTQSVSTAQTADQPSTTTQSSSATQTAAYANGMFWCDFKFNIVVY